MLLRLLTLAILLTIGVSQPNNCTNAYQNVNNICQVGGNPGCCSQNLPCILTNLSALITTNSSGEYYILCIFLTGNLNITNTTEVIQGALNIQALNVNIYNSSLTVQVSEQYLNISQIASAFNIVINGSSLAFSYLSFLPTFNLLANSTNIVGFTTLNISQPDNVSLSGCTLVGQQFLLLLANQVVLNQFTNITAEQAFLSSFNNLTLMEGSMIMSNRAVCDSTCNCSSTNPNDSYCNNVGQQTVPLAWQGTNFSLNALLPYQLNMFLQNYTITLIAENIKFNNSMMRASGIGLYANSTYIGGGSNITTKGLGCRAEMGYGCGYYDLTLNQLLSCTGTGGSYGGLGGNSAPDPCTLLASRRTYGSLSFPLNKGSGGGNPLDNTFSTGGGLIVIQTYILTVDSTSAVISDGENGPYSAGGGSGGSINIQTAFVNGSGVLSANGGSGNSSGGGGRISLQFMMWSERSFVQLNNDLGSTLKISTEGGANNISQLSSGLRGSFYTTTCLPGMYLSTALPSNNYLCVLCPNGTFKSIYGYGQCVACLKTEGALYNTSGQTSLSACSAYTCPNLFESQNKLCLTSSQKFVDAIGGQNIVISICMVLGSLIIYGLFVLLLKLIKKKDVPLSSTQALEHTLKQFAQKPMFQIEQLPYHEYRIYLSGTNSPVDPWHIDKQVISSVPHRFIRSQKFDKIIDEINQLCQFKIWQQTLIYFLRFYYYPLADFIQTKIKENKAKNLSRLIKRLQKDLPDWQEVTIKINVMTNNNVACLEIFNYQRSLYDFYLENCLPLVFVLEKRPLGGYMLDFSDPFLKAMIIYRDIKFKDDPDYVSFEKYCEELNELLLQVPNMDPLLGHLAQADRYGVQLYLVQPPDNILNLYPKERYSSSKELLLVVVEENIVCRHFYMSNPLPSLECQPNERNQWQLAQRQEDKPSLVGVSLLSRTKTRKIVFIWTIGVINILSLINQSIIFYLVVKFPITAFLCFYFILFPLDQFVSCALNFIWCLKPTFKIGVSTILFSLANVIKSMILSIAFFIITAVNGNSENNELVGFFLISNFILTLLILGFQRKLLWACRNLK